MPSLATRFTVIAPDLLGHGESAKPRGDYSLGAYASGVRDLLVALGHERATFVGHSLGGGDRDAARLPVPRALRAPRARRQRRAGPRGEHPAARRDAARLGVRAAAAGPRRACSARAAVVGRMLGRVGLHAGTDMARDGAAATRRWRTARRGRRSSTPCARSSIPRGQRVERHRPALPRREHPVPARSGASATRSSRSSTATPRTSWCPAAGSRCSRTPATSRSSTSPQRFLDVAVDFIDSTEPADTDPDQLRELLQRRCSESA